MASWPSACGWSPPEPGTVGTAYLLYQYILLIQDPIDRVTQQFSELQKAAGGIVRIDQYRAMSSRGWSTARAPAELPVRAAGSVEFDRGPTSPTRTAPPTSIASCIGLTFSAGARHRARPPGPDRRGQDHHHPVDLPPLRPGVEGIVRIGGLDALRSVSPWPRSGRRVGVVPQDVQLFRASVRDNLTFFDRSTARTDELHGGPGSTPAWGSGSEASASTAELGAGGSGLSAGESQLLAFARVFLQDPGVVILDEPASRLDPATEVVVAGATERLFARPDRGHHRPPPRDGAAGRRDHGGRRRPHRRARSPGRSWPPPRCPTTPTCWPSAAGPCWRAVSRGRWRFRGVGADDDRSRLRHRGPSDETGPDGRRSRRRTASESTFRVGCRAAPLPACPVRRSMLRLLDRSSTAHPPVRRGADRPDCSMP